MSWISHEYKNDIELKDNVYIVSFESDYTWKQKQGGNNSSAFLLLVWIEKDVHVTVNMIECILAVYTTHTSV